MSRQLYTYSMPESFMKDQSVPARWRLLGLINGFHINGKTFYASNAWIMEHLDCSEQTVSNAVSELETLGEIRCERTKRSRLIYRETQTNLGLRPEPALVSDPNQLGTNSDNNSDNELGADAQVEEVITDLHGDEKPKKGFKPAQYPHSKEVFSWFPNPQKSWERNTTELWHTNLLFGRGEGQVRAALRFVAENKDDSYCPQVVKPSDLERKWPDIVAYKEKNGL